MFGEDKWGNFQFTVLAICSCLRIGSAILLQLKEHYSYNKVHKQSWGNALTQTAAASDMAFRFYCAGPNFLQAPRHYHSTNI